MSENNNTTETEATEEKRTVFIGAKVTPQQKEFIQSQAKLCGMTVSDYLLARAYNYKPKARLTKQEATLLQNLDNCRIDLVRYTSALHGMTPSQRLMMFNHIPFMVDWLKRLGQLADRLCEFLNSVKEHNTIPHTKKEKDDDSQS